MTESPAPVLRGRQAEAARNDRPVLDAARDVFARHGADAPVSAIAERAGVGMGSLYRRYGSKADLLRHLCTLAMESRSRPPRRRSLSRTRGPCRLRRGVRGAGHRRAGALAGAIQTTPEMWAVSKRGRALLDDS